VEKLAVAFSLSDKTRRVFDVNESLALAGITMFGPERGGLAGPHVSRSNDQDHRLPNAAERNQAAEI
jgi:hypothetical protein